MDVSDKDKMTFKNKPRWQANCDFVAYVLTYENTSGQPNAWNIIRWCYVDEHKRTHLLMIKATDKITHLT